MALKWWQRAVFYQIYPRSFADSNGDGIGDLDGITAHLDYLNDGTERSLGIDAIWLNPINPSPNKDWGYDVSNYCGINPEFGDMASFDRLLKEAHRRGIRVIVDLVPNHTSDQHPWFVESRASKTNPKRDWYIWKTASPDKAPNNWHSQFGGPAWKLDVPSGEYYLHLFLDEQPDLNYRNPAVVEAMHDVIRFWLERGADGYRIDVVAQMMKDAAFRDNPFRTAHDPDIPWFEEGSQIPLHSTDQIEVHDVIRGFRLVADSFDDRVLVGETWPIEQERLADYLRPDELHLAFNFRFVLARYMASRFRDAIATTHRTFGPGAWPTWTLSNHDFSRHISRYSDGGDGIARARVAALMMLTLRGTPFIYYGEEIGMRDVRIPRERRRDPVGRDGCRTPMQWSRSPGAGFSTAASTWLPIGEAKEVNVAAQLDDPRSMLSFYRRLIRLRRETPALVEGSFRLQADSPADCLIYHRESPAHRLLVALNFGAEPREISSMRGRLIFDTDLARIGEASGATLKLAGNEAVIVES